MKLTLRLADHEADTGQTRTLETGRLTVGRGADNDWVLADPDRTLSKNHCRIDASEGGFMLTDLSTNGVFLSGVSHPIGRGQSCALEDGDSFAIGPYRLHAAIEGGEESAFRATGGLSLPQAAEGNGFSPAPSASPLAPAIPESWAADLPSGGFGPDRRAAREGWEAPPDPAAYAASGFDQTSQLGTRTVPEDPFAAGPALFSQHSEHIAAGSTVMRVPEPQVVLPSDWNVADPMEPAPGLADAVSDGAWPPALPPEPPRVTWPPVLPEAPPPPPALPADWLAQAGAGAAPRLPMWEPSHALEAPRSTAPSPPAPTPPSPPLPASVAPRAAETRRAPPKPAAPARPAARRAAPAPPPAPVQVRPAPPPPPGAAPLPPPSRPAVEPGTAGQLLQAFLDGAGLPPDTLDGLDPAEAMRDVGRTVRAAVDGVRDIMSTRALVKSEFRVDQTVLRRSDNNAVKFAPDVQRCLAAMVGAAPPGFLPGPAAMKQSMDDIKLHELALVAALNSVFADLDQQLDPDAIMRRARQDSGVATMLPYAREAKCWATFVEAYRLLQDSGAPNTGGSLLAPLAQAYARQLRRPS